MRKFFFNNKILFNSFYFFYYSFFLCFEVFLVLYLKLCFKMIDCIRNWIYYDLVDYICKCKICVLYNDDGDNNDDDDYV